jgi:branched-chain amino acid transport system ATP-binding protein
VLEAHDISRSFGGIRANRGITLSIGAGEIRGLIGPNGAGKTTFVNVVTGIYRPTAGSVRLNGTDITGWAPMRISRAGMVRTFQTPKLFATMTVEENLMVPAVARRNVFARRAVEGAADRAEELLALTRLDRRRQLPAKALSGGEQALLQVASGFMVADLACYVLDEPFAGINPVLKDRVIELLIHENRTRGVALLVISHEMDTVRKLCPRVSVLAEGQLLTEGTMDEVVADPRVIAAYLGRS